MSFATHQSCIDACIECARACEECFAACLTEPHVAKMSQCLRLDRDCAELCWLTAGFLHRDSEFNHDLCAVCAEVCRACGDECRTHDHDHCQKCADACDRCAAECGRMLTATV